MWPAFVSLDHFRSRVYRQRVALVVLIVLLGISDCTEQYHKSSQVSSRQAVAENDGGDHSGILGHTPTAVTVRRTVARWIEKVYPQDRTSDAIASAGSTDALSNTGATTSNTGMSQVWNAGGYVTLFVEEKGQVSHSRPRSTNQKHDDLSGFAAVTPKTLLLPTILPPLVQLHSLWAVRFVAGEFEGRFGTKSLRPQRPPFRRTLLASLVLAVVTVVAALPCTSKQLRDLANRWTGMSASMPTVFPLVAILLLELVPTIASLAPLALMLFPTRLPATLDIPSPSHAPPLLDCLPLCIRAPFAPSERARARRAAIGASRARRHGGFGAAHALNSMTRTVPESGPPTTASSPTRRFHDLPNETIHQVEPRHNDSASVAPSSGASMPQDPSRLGVDAGDESSRLSQESDLGSEASASPNPSPVTSGSLEGARLMRLQQELLDELEQAGKVDSPTSEQARSQARAKLEGKAGLRRRHQTVTLPTAYVVSVALMVLSFVSTIASYAVITFRLPTLTPTSVPAVVALLAFRAEIGGLAKSWQGERRKMEGLEFVRRRWGVSSSDNAGNGPGPTEGEGKSAPQDTTSCCAICFEAILWTDETEDAVRLDCQHELHAPCLVPWLMSQAFCPVCHQSLRPARPSSVGSARSSMAGSRRRSQRPRHDAVAGGSGSGSGSGSDAVLPSSYNTVSSVGTN